MNGKTREELVRGKITEAPGEVFEGDTCDRCGKQLNPSTDGCLLHVQTNKLFCVACALEREGMSKEETTPELVECTKREVDKSFPDLLIEGNAIPFVTGDVPGMLKSLSEHNRFTRHLGETDTEFCQRVLIETLFIARGMTGTRDEIRNVLSMTDGVRFAGIIDRPEEHGVEILIIGEDFNRQDIAAALYNCLAFGVATFGEHTEVYIDQLMTHEYRWTEFKTPDDFVMWYVKNHYNVKTATGEALDRLAELTPIDPRQLLTLGPIKVGDK